MGIAAVTASGVVLVGVLWALLLAVGLSILDTVARSAKPHGAVLGWVERLDRYGDVSVHPSARQTPGVVVYRLDDRLFYANWHYVTGRSLKAVDAPTGDVRWLVFDAEGVADIDASGVAAVEQLAASLAARGVGFAVARLRSPLVQRLDATGLTDLIGARNFHPTVERAVAASAARPPPASAITPPG